MVLFTTFVQTKFRPCKLNLDRTVYTVFRNIRYWLPVKHGTGNPGMEWGMEWNGMEWGMESPGIVKAGICKTRNCKSRNL